MKNSNITKIDTNILNKDAVAVENFPDVLAYICNDIKRSIRLTSFLKKELTEIFGKHNTTFKGEFYYYVWVVEFQGNIFNIYTANEKGTQFAIVSDSKIPYHKDTDKSIICVKFLSKIEELLLSKFYSSVPDKNFETWDELFDFQACKEGANYSLLKEWLKKYYKVPKLK